MSIWSPHSTSDPYIEVKVDESVSHLQRFQGMVTAMSELIGMHGYIQRFASMPSPGNWNCKFMFAPISLSPSNELWLYLVLCIRCEDNASEASLPCLQLSANISHAWDSTGFVEYISSTSLYQDISQVWISFKNWRGSSILKTVESQVLAKLWITQMQSL